MNIKKIHKKLKNEESRNFTVDIQQEEDLAKLYTKDGKAYGAVEVLYADFISPESERNPFEIFEENDSVFEEIKKQLSNEIFGFSPSKISKPKFLEYLSGSFLMWHDAENKQSYFLVASVSEEEGEFGYYACLFLCRIESN